MDSGWRQNKYGGWFNINEAKSGVKSKRATNKYMNDKIRKGAKKITKDEYIFNKEQRQQPLMQAFGLRPQEEKFRYRADKLLEEAKKRKK